MATEPRGATSGEADEDISLFAIGSVFLGRRRTIVAFGLAGVAIGLATGLLKTKVYKSSATFVPQATDANATSGLASLATQFGVRVPTAGASAWGTAIYVQLLKSRMMLEPIALDTLEVPEDGGKRVAVMDLLEISKGNLALRPMRTIEALANLIATGDDNRLNLVRLSVETKWPSVSLAIAQRLVRGINQFNLETRQSQAVAEKVFVEKQVAAAGQDLRAAEDEMQRFLQRNRVADSPELRFGKERLQRVVTQREQVYGGLLQSLEEAKIRAVRDVPVITILEEPRLAVQREARGTIQKGILGGIVGLVLGVLFAFVAQGLANARRSTDPDTTRFLKLLDDSTPGFLRRWVS